MRRPHASGRLPRAAPAWALAALALAGCPQLLSDEYDVEPVAEPGDDPCADGQRSGGESDVDCGGERCAPCADGAECERNEDCESDRCSSHRCEAD